MLRSLNDLLCLGVDDAGENLAQFRFGQISRPGEQAAILFREPGADIEPGELLLPQFVDGFFKGGASGNFVANLARSYGDLALGAAAIGFADGNGCGMSHKKSSAMCYQLTSEVCDTLIAFAIPIVYACDVFRGMQ